MSETTDPGGGMTSKQEQADRIQKFLTRLATEDDFLLRYAKDPIEVLQGELDASPRRLALADIALLLAGSCCELHELMREGASPMGMSESVKWPRLWNFSW